MGPVSADQAPKILLAERAFVDQVRPLILDVQAAAWVVAREIWSVSQDEVQRYDAAAKAPSEALCPARHRCLPRRICRWSPHVLLTCSHPCCFSKHNIEAREIQCLVYAQAR